MDVDRTPLLTSPDPASSQLPAQLLSGALAEPARGAGDRSPRLTAKRGTTRVRRTREWAYPPVPVHREVISEQPAEDTGRPPVLFVPGLRHAAWCFAEHWLPRAAERGFPAYAMSLRGHGGSGGAERRRRTGLDDYVHDVMQVAASLPRQAVLVGHGVGGLVVARVLARYPARAGVLVAPVIAGWRALGSALLRHPFGAVPGLFGGSVGLRGGQLFSRRLDKDAVRRYRSRLDPSAPRVQRQLLLRRGPEPALPGTPMLVVGSPQDKLVGQRALQKIAGRYDTEPLLFPGMGHDMMLDARWVEPLDAILDWLSDK